MPVRTNTPHRTSTPRRTAPRRLAVLTVALFSLAGGAAEASAGGAEEVAAPTANAGDRTATTADRTRRPADELTFTVADSGSSARDGSYTLRCHPARGEHPSPRRACAALDRATSRGGNPFRPVSPGAVCTMIYGGPATAHVTGTWRGRSVNARFERTNGCEVERWNRLVPALPRTS